MQSLQDLHACAEPTGGATNLESAKELRLAYEAALSAAIVQHSDDAIIAKGLDGTVLSWNAGAERIFGYSSREMVGEPITRLFPMDRLREEPELLRRVALGETVAHFVTQRIRKDGALIDISVTLSPVRDENGNTIAISKIARDITQASGQLIVANRSLRRKMEELQRSEERFQSLVRLTSQVIWTNNPDGLMEGVQSGWSAFTGQSFDEYQGYGWAAAVHPDDAQPTVDEWKRSVAERRHFRFEHRVRRHDGVYRICQIDATPVLNDDGSIREWVGVHNDITGRRQQEEQTRVEQAKFRFLAESTPQMVWTAMPDGHADYYNQRWFSYTGMTPQQCESGEWGPVHPDDLANSVRVWNVSVKTGDPYQVEHRFKRAVDDTYRWHLCSALALRDAHGNIVKWFGTCTDIHDYKEATAKHLALLAELEVRVRERTAEVYDAKERLTLATDAAAIGVWEWDLSSNTLRWDDRTYHLYGREPAAGREPYALWAASLHADDRERAERAINVAVQKGVNFDTEFRIVWPGGEIRHIRAVAQVQYDATGAALRMVGVNFDITAAKIADQELRTVNERLLMATEAAAIGIWDYVPKSASLRCDDAMCGIYGRPPGSLTNYAQWAEHLHPEDRERTLKAIERALKGQAAYDLEFRICRPSGEIRHLKAAGRVQRDNLGAPILMVGINYDITERTRTELELNTTSSLLRSVLDSAIDLSIIASTPDYAVKVFNKGAERLLGYTSAEFVDTLTVGVLHDVDEVNASAAEMSTALGRLVEGIGVFTDPSVLSVPREWTYIRKDRSRVPVSLTVSTMRRHDGTVSGFLGVARDITQARAHDSALRDAMSRAEQASAAKSQFLANMSHEIRTPLNAVIGLGYLLEQTPLSQEQRLFLAKINFAGRSLLSVVNNVLDLSKIEAGEMILDETDFDLVQLVRDIGQMLHPQAQAKQIELRLLPVGEFPPRLRGDATRLRQIITNLLNNAIKFTELGHVELMLSCAEANGGATRLHCSVRDTGIGIPTEALERLFTPFAQADASTTRRFGGTGLGLSIARGCVGLMGGEINVVSAPGVGSNFSFQLPLRIASAGGKDAPVGGERALSVLIVEMTTGPQAIDAIVRPFGWLPHSVPHGEDAMEHLRGLLPAAWPDVVLIDGHLQDSAAAYVISQIRHEFSHLELPLVVVVLDPAETDLQRTLQQQGASAVISRPVTSSAVFNAVNAALAKRSGDHHSILRATQFDEAGVRWLPGAHVLVVDDSDINREVAKHILQRQGAKVTTDCNGVEAVERLRKYPDAFDIVLMDVQMPEMDGNEATRRIRDELQLHALPIVALTAGALVSERERCLKAGMNDFLSKPLEPVALIRAVRGFIEKRRGVPMAVGVGDGETREHALAAGLAHIDQKVARQVFGGDSALFADLLMRMLRDFSEFSLPVAVEVSDDPVRSRLKARVHKLRGSAGAIGAMTIQHLAAAAERALEEGQPADFVEAMLRQIAVALTELGEEVRPLIEAQAARSAAARAALPPSPAATETMIGHLLDMLEGQNLDALERFELIAPSLSTALGVDRVSQVRVAIEDLEFSTAATLLRGDFMSDESPASEIERGM